MGEYYHTLMGIVEGKETNNSTAFQYCPSRNKANKANNANGEGKAVQKCNSGF